MDRDLPEATEQLVEMIARGQLTSSAFRQPFGDPWGGPGPDGNEPRVPTEEEFAASLKRILATPSPPRLLEYIVLDHAAPGGTPRTEVDNSGRQFVRIQPSVLDALRVVPPEKPGLGMGITGAAGIPVYRTDDLPDGMGER